MKKNINQISSDLYFINLCLQMPGFENFIGVWLYQGEITYLVDVGPAVVSDKLIQIFQYLNIKKLDYIFLTHIHLDHAGAIGEISNFFPDTPIICHKSAIQHLTNPTKLWDGTIKTLGEIGRYYGRMKAVDANRLVDASDFYHDKIEPVVTPGHAVHHVSYNTEKYLFAGEAGGAFSMHNLDNYYLRPATPHKFLFETTINSIKNLISKKPLNICYGHYGIKDNAVEMLKTYKSQLCLWKKIIDEQIETQKDNFLIETCLEKLFQEDKLLSSFFKMNANEQKREKFFLTNSIKGFIG